MSFDDSLSISKSGEVGEDPRHTSQTCPQCGHQAKENRLSQAEFRCVECFFEGDADRVASQNILRRGLGFLN